MNARLAEIKIAILEDKKKAGVLAVLVLVALIVGVRTLVKTGPKKAAASATTPDITLAAQQTGAITIASIDPAKLAETTRRHAASDVIARDPFALDPDAFPALQAPKSGSASSEDQQGAALSTAAPADLAAESLRRMRVRSVIIGPRPVAVIEWRAETAAQSYTLSVGDHLDGFTVTSITRSEVALSRDGSAYTLPIEPPSK